MSIGVPYETFWSLNPKTLQIFFDVYKDRMKRENELKGLEMDIFSWKIGYYVREAIVSAFNRGAKYPVEPYSITKDKQEHMTAKDHANNFREFLKHYKRPPVVPGGE